MNKLALYLQEHVTGEVNTSAAAKNHFSTDAGILKIQPAVIVYPKNETDIRKVVRFAYQLAEKGKILPITSRGSGTDLGSASIGNGILLVTTAHMNKILGIDGKNWTISVQPGANFGKIQQSLITHYREIPAYPASIEYSTIGGAIANNSAGEKSIKYGPIGKYVQALRVVLSSGDVIETGRISKKEVNKKMGLTTFEGEIYRQLNGLLTDYEELIKERPIPVVHNNSGYNIWDIKGKDGSIDLTPLFVGSQGTLGIITDATMSTVMHNSESTVVVAIFENMEKLLVASNELIDTEPATMEMYNDIIIGYLKQNYTKVAKEVLGESVNGCVLVLEYDHEKPKDQKKAVKKCQKILQKYASDAQISMDFAEKEKLMQIKSVVSTLLWNQSGNKSAVPLLDDASLPPSNIHEFIKRATSILSKYGQTAYFWGSPADGRLHTAVYFDITQATEKQRMFRLVDEYYRLVIDLGGSPSGQHNDGRIRGYFVSKSYSQDTYGLMVGIKNIFDPKGILNPGVKIGTSVRTALPFLRTEYSLNHIYDHSPRI